nr:hypothetical protein [Mucilaginibacter sp. FT3.2]
MLVRKVTFIIGNTLKRIGKEEIDLTITVRHEVSEFNYWRTCYIGKHYNPKKMSLLTRKKNDWL